jgi:hypothetical protein
MQSLTRAARYSVLPGMNDTVWTMRLCGLLLLAACSGDPSLDVSVHHPAGYAVTQTIVTVYFGDDISCSAIEYGDRTDAELAAIAADEVDVTSGGRVEVSRLGGKSLVARGYDAQHRFVTAGCKDAGEITPGTRLTIATQPTAVVAVDPGQAEQPFSLRTIVVNMSDSNGMPLDGNVSWLLTGPAGAPVQQPSAGVATKAGNAKIHVDDLGTPGPEGLRIRVPWATAPLPLVTGFDLSHMTTLSLGGGAFGGHPSCDLRGHAGKLPTLVCLDQANAVGHRDVVEIAWQASTNQYAVTPLPALPAAINNQFALFVDHDGSADEPVYVLSEPGTGNWYKLGAAGSGTTVVFDSALQNVVYVPSCQANSMMPFVAVETGTATSIVVPDKLAFYSVSGTLLAAPQPGGVFSGGCVHDVDKIEHQAVFVSGSGDEAGLVLTTAGPAQMPISPTKLTGSGFVAVESQGVLEKRFAGTRLQAAGTVVFEAVLALENNAYKLVERTELDSAGPPDKIVGSKLDQDGDTDLMWDMTIGLRRRVFQVSLAEQVSGDPLTAITGGATGGTTTAAVDFITGDLNGRHTDELVVFSASGVTIFSADQ